MWIYNQVVFTRDMIPAGAVGFVYEMTAIIKGKSYSYIGKKSFFSSRKKKLSNKNLSTDKRKKKYEIVNKLNYEDYYSSNVTLKEAHKSGIKISRKILRICYTKGELTYQEVKYQFIHGVLENDLYLNANILGRFYKQK